MKILQLCKKFPYPLKDGESIAVTYLSNALHNLGCDVSLLAMNTSKHYTDLQTLPADFNHYKEIHVTQLDNVVSVAGAFKNLFSKDSYHVSRFISQEFEAKLIALLTTNEYDVVQLETLYLAPYIDVIKKYSNALVTMRAHNVEFEIWERITNNTKFLPKKLYLKYLTAKLKKYELEHLNKYDYLIAVSDRDLKKFKELGYKNGAMSSPIGLDLKQYNIATSVKDSLNTNLCFIGALDWMPNMEGLKWFLDEVWPKVNLTHPNVKFHIAGRNTPQWLLDLDQPNVKVHGEVDDAIAFVNQYTAMIVPLFSGSGMRVKILEGMALGKVVITTNMGREGIEATHAKELLIANTPEEFLTEISNLVNNKYDVSTIGQNAQTFVSDFYDHGINANKLLEKYLKLKTDPHYSKILVSEK
jgi:polysaccharide biosynthesis protein PslH